MIDYWLFFGISVPFIAFVLEVLKELSKPKPDDTVTKMFETPKKVNSKIQFFLMYEHIFQDSKKSNASVFPEAAGKIGKNWTDNAAFGLVSICAKVLLPILSLIFIIIYFVLVVLHYTDINN